MLGFFGTASGLQSPPGLDMICAPLLADGVLRHTFYLGSLHLEFFLQGGGRHYPGGSVSPLPRVGLLHAVGGLSASAMEPTHWFLPECDVGTLTKVLHSLNH